MTPGIDFFTAEAFTIQRMVMDRCHHRVKRAVASGWLKKPKRCTRCGGHGTVEAHHLDYLEPLNVEWICRSCQRRLHFEMDKKLREAVDKILPVATRQHGKDGRFLSREDRNFVHRRLLDFGKGRR